MRRFVGIVLLLLGFVCIASAFVQLPNSPGGEVMHPTMFTVGCIGGVLLLIVGRLLIGQKASIYSPRGARPGGQKGTAMKRFIGIVLGLIGFLSILYGLLLLGSQTGPYRTHVRLTVLSIAVGVLLLIVGAVLAPRRGSAQRAPRHGGRAADFGAEGPAWPMADIPGPPQPPFIPQQPPPPPYVPNVPIPPAPGHHHQHQPPPQWPQPPQPPYIPPDFQPPNIPGLP